MLNYLNYSNIIDNSEIKFEKDPNLSDRLLGQCKDVTIARGYYSNGQPSFSAMYDKDNNYRITFYEEGKEPRAKDEFSSDMEDDIAHLPESIKKKYYAAKLAIQKLQTIEKQQTNSSKPKSLAESLKDGVKVSLSPESRLSFAPDIEELRIRKDKEGFLHIVGASKDGGQEVNFSFKDGIISLELTIGKRTRSYNNKFGEFTYRDADASNQTRYRDHDNGKKYAEELAGVMDKLKLEYQQRSNTQTRSAYSPERR
ncbi:MAG: hypothetical protein E7019_02075 [Alphaproteobacteria bacterium]|nr:hypothetical protein [Alphaproteobacteria bacterium]